MGTPLEGTESSARSIARVTYTHDAMINLILAQPSISKTEIAKHFGYSLPWVSRIFNSDAFLARLAVRQAELIDPTIVQNLDEKIKMAAGMSFDVLIEKLEKTQSADLALEVANLSTKALGYGARQQNVNVQQNFVVALPTKAENGDAWAAQHGANRQQIPGVEDATITSGEKSAD